MCYDGRAFHRIGFESERNAMLIQVVSILRVFSYNFHFIQPGFRICTCDFRRVKKTRFKKGISHEFGELQSFM